MSTPQPPHASPTPHIDVETLADLQEGLLDAARVTAVAAHVAGCVPCRARRDALEDVRGLLRDEGAAGPETAPEDVVRRLDDALAAAYPRVATASATVTPLPTARRSPWRTRGLQAAAVFVLVAAVGGIGYGGIRALTNGPDSAGDTAASSAGGSSAQTERGLGTGKYRITSSGRDYTQAALRAAVPELLAGSLPATAKDGTAGAPANPGSAAPANPGSAAAPTAKPSASPTGSGSFSGATTDPERLRAGAALAACVANLTGGPVTPLAVDLGRFEGKPATIIVLPDPDDRTVVDVYAVAPDCPTGTFLTYERVPLP